MSATKITPSDIIKSFNENGNDLVKVLINKDIDKSMKRYFNNSVCYIKLQFKIDDNYVPATMSFSPTAIPSGIISPEQRQYPDINIAFSEDFIEPGDTKLVGKIGDSQVGKALSIICEATEAKLKELIDKKVISDDKKNAKMSVIFPSVKFGQPKREGSEDRSNKGEFKMFDSPRYYLSLPLKDKKDDNSPFKVPFYKISKRTKVEATNEDGNQFTAADIHQFITRGSIVTGSIKFELVGSSLKLNLKAEFVDEMIVKTCQDAGSAKKVPEEYLDAMYGLDSDDDEEKGSLAKEIQNMKMSELDALGSDDDDE